MTASLSRLLAASAVVLVGAIPSAAQVAPKAEDLMGTWELVSTKNLKTGAVTPANGTQWIQFTRSHWILLNMQAGRKPVTTEEFNKLSPDAQVKANYARVWNEKNEQIFVARGGTYRLDGDKLHHPATLAIYTSTIGVDRVLKITRLDKAMLVAQTEYPDQPNTTNEVTYRRID